MALTRATPGGIIKSTEWNSLIDEINLKATTVDMNTKVSKAGDIMTGPLRINNALTTTGTILANSFSTLDPATNAAYRDNWIGMANNISGATKWLHIGGITDADNIRRIALFANQTLVSGNLSFGSQTRQMINLWSTEYGIGVQAGTAYFRSFAHFGWHKGGVHSDTQLDPGVGGTRLMHLDSSGNLVVSGSVYLNNSDLYFNDTTHVHSGIGNTLGHAAIENSAAPYNALMILGRNVGPGTNRIVKLWDYFEVNGIAAKTGGGAWLATSDKKLKKNIKTIEGALDKLTQLRGVTFEWKDEEKMGGQKGIQTGMVAQEVEPVFPEWVINDVNGNKAIGFTGFEALVVESLKELKNEITQIKAHLKI